MTVGFRSLNIPSATLVANEFIDQFMPQANGEYVKVYLYLLRHAGEDVTYAQIADALELTEGDVRRAVLRWEKEGLITLPADGKAAGSTPDRKTVPAAAEKAPVPAEAVRESAAPAAAVLPADTERTERPAEYPQATAQQDITMPDCMPVYDETPAEQPRTEELPAEDRTVPAEEPRKLPDKSEVNIARLKDDEEFASLLYVVQRYLSRIFSQTDSETIAYLYDVLKMPAELIEYLAELCAERGKTSLRYLESIALDWHTRGIRTAAQAKAEGGIYSGEVYGVMKAFGLNGRNPGEQEQKLIRKWFRTYGFTKELVLEACARTLAATQKPSFQYADSILTGWHGQNVRTMADVRKIDTARGEKAKQTRPVPPQTGRSGSRFNNFEQRDNDLDSLVVQEMNRKLNRN